MNRHFHIACYLIVAFSLSCEEVIQIEVPEDEPKLMIDAVIRIDENERFTNVAVKVGQTSPFFGTTPLTDLQHITIVNLDAEDSSVLELAEIPRNSGIYRYNVKTEFFTQGRLIFQLQNGNRRYLARAEYVPVVDIDTFYIGNEVLFDKDDTEAIVSFRDDATRDDQYVFDFDFGEYFVSEDEFYQGQQFQFSYFYRKKVEIGQTLSMSILGADQGFHDYMKLLIEQSQDEFGPFDTPVATVRGNILDVTDIDNIDKFDNVATPEAFALGYFAVVQAHNHSIIYE